MEKDRTSYAFHASSFVLEEELAGSGWLLVRDGVFDRWIPEDRFPSDAGDGQHMELVELGDVLVAPGYVDTHIHGFAGHDVMDASPQALDDMSRALAQEGTTSWLPTTLTAPFEQVEAACAAVAQALDGTARNAEVSAKAHIRGIHVEGPFFTEEHAGAQNSAYLADADAALVRRWNDASGGRVRKLSLAPEREGALACIRELAAQGIVCSLGHTSASYEQAVAALDAGAGSFTHTYNGMALFSHREPGVLGAAFTRENSYCELIADGFHVDSVACDLLVRARGWQHVALVTDCLSCGGMPEGEYVLGELPIVLSGGVARLRDKGNIAGSVLTLAQAVRNIAAWGIATQEEAIRMASEVPAKSAGIFASCGSIASGKAADFNVLDKDLRVLATYVDGRIV